MKMLKICLIIADLVLLYLYTFPIFSGIRSIGNYFGIFICVVVLAYLVFQKQINSFIVEIWQGIAGKITISAFSVVLALSFLYAAVGTALMISYANKSPSDNATVIVLGCKVNGTKPSLMLKQRLNAATDYLKANPDTNCVVSGGKGSDEGISEAQCMHDYLIAKGIDEKRIFIEDKSTTTEENLKFSKQIISDNNLNSNIAIVTDGFHEFRASFIANKIGFSDIGAVSATTPFPYLPCYHLRELFAIVNEVILK